MIFVISQTTIYEGICAIKVQIYVFMCLQLENTLQFDCKSHGITFVFLEFFWTVPTLHFLLNLFDIDYCTRKDTATAANIVHLTETKLTFILRQA